MHYHTYIMKMMIKALKPTAFTAFIPFFRLFSPNLSSNFLSIKFFIGEGACVGNRVHGVSLWLIVHILDGTRRHHSKGAKHGLFLFIFVLFKHKFYRKTVGFSGIQTRNVKVVGEHADHLTTTTVAPPFKVDLTRRDA